MTKDQIMFDVKKFLKKEYALQENDITPDTLLSKDLGLDSLDRMELVYALEQKYNVSIDGKSSVKVLDDMAMSNGDISVRVLVDIFAEELNAE